MHASRFQAYNFLLFGLNKGVTFLYFQRRHPLNTIMIDVGDSYTLLHNLLLICLLLAAKKNFTLIQPQSSQKIKCCLQGPEVLLLNHSSPNAVEQPPPTEVESAFWLISVLGDAGELINLVHSAPFPQDQFWSMFIFVVRNFEFLRDYHM